MIMRLMRQKFHLWVFWTLTVVLAVGLVLPGIGIGADRDAVAVVGGDPIKMDEFNRSVTQVMENERGRLGGELSEGDNARLRRQTLDQMIDEKLAIRGLKELGLHMGEEEVRQNLMNDPSFRDETGAFSQARYYQFLNMQAERGLSPAETEALISRSLRLSRGRIFFSTQARLTPQELEQGLKRIHRRVKAKLLSWDYKSVQAGLKHTEDDLRSYYAENRQRWVKPEEVKASHILVRVDALTGTQVAKAKADELYARLKKGEDFAEVAKKNSQDESNAMRGGDMGWLSRSGTNPELAPIFKLKAGEMGEPFMSSQGWHIAKVTAKKEGFEPSFDNSRAKVLEDYSLDKAKKLVRQNASRAAKKLEEGMSLEETAKLTEAQLRTTGWFGKDEKSLVAGLGDSLSLAEDLLYLEKGQRLSSPQFLEKGAVLAEITEEEAGTVPKDEVKLSPLRVQVTTRLRSEKATVLYEGWLNGLKKEIKIVDRFEKLYGKQ